MVEPRIVEDDKGFLVITVPLKTAVKERSESSTGKSMILASTRGNMKIDTKAAGVVHVGLNVYQRNPNALAEAGREAGTR